LRVVERMHRSKLCEAVEGVVVCVPASERTQLQIIARPELDAVIQQKQRGLQVLGLVRIERRVEVGPAKSLSLIPCEQIRLTGAVAQLEPNVCTIELVFTERNRPV